MSQKNLTIDEFVAAIYAKETTELKTCRNGFVEYFNDARAMQCHFKAALQVHGQKPATKITMDDTPCEPTTYAATKATARFPVEVFVNHIAKHPDILKDGRKELQKENNRHRMVCMYLSLVVPEVLVFALFRLSQVSLTIGLLWLIAVIPGLPWIYEKTEPKGESEVKLTASLPEIRTWIQETISKGNYASETLTAISEEICEKLSVEKLPEDAVTKRHSDDTLYALIHILKEKLLKAFRDKHTLLLDMGKKDSDWLKDQAALEEYIKDLTIRGLATTSVKTIFAQAKDSFENKLSPVKLKEFADSMK